MTFKAQKRPNAQPDVIQHGAHSAALRPFNQALLFQTAMIHFNPPRRESKLFAFGFGHLEKARRPVFRCAVCGTNPKHFDFSESLEPQERPVTAAQPGLRNCFQLAVPDSNLPIGFEPGQKMPAQATHQFEVLNRPTTFCRNTPVAG